MPKLEMQLLEVSIGYKGVNCKLCVGGLGSVGSMRKTLD